MYVFTAETLYRACVVAMLPNTELQPFLGNTTRILMPLAEDIDGFCARWNATYLIYEALCKFYYAGSLCAGTREFISRWKRTES